MDHVFDKTELYPAAGMVVMALEAARQMSDPGRKVSGYRLRNVNFVKPLVLSNRPEGVETQFHLSQPQNQSHRSTEWYTFRLFARANNEWLSICWGTIITEYQGQNSEVDQGLEASAERKQYLQRSSDAQTMCNRTVISKQMYSNLNDFGFYFGPTFQTLQEICYGDSGQATAQLKFRVWCDRVENSANVQPHIIHPTALDSFFHLTVVAVTKGAWQRIPIMVPTHIEELWISHRLFSEPNRQHAKVHSEPKSQGYREAVFDIFALDLQDGQPLIAATDYRATAISSLNLTSNVQQWRRLCFGLEWKIDIDMIQPDELAARLDQSTVSADLYPEWRMDRLELICLYFLCTVSDALLPQDHMKLEPHLKKYVEWMHWSLSRTSAKATLSSPEALRIRHDADYREAVLQEMEHSNTGESLFVIVGRELLSILQGRTNALSLLFEGDLMQDFYSSTMFTANNHKVAEYVRLLAHSDASLSFLEIGAGTGGATAAVLKSLEPPRGASDLHGTYRYSQYTFTDVSPAFFEPAADRFKAHSSRMTFQILDIEKDPVAQGFEAGQYDVIVASFVLHATATIKQTLMNVRQLLKPGGRLILYEPCNLECARSTLAFGLLPGWWLATEDERRWGPLLTDDSWIQKLRQTGFKDNGIVLRDYQGLERHSSSVIIATADTDPFPSNCAPKVNIIMRDPSVEQRQAADGLIANIQSVSRGHIDVLTLNEVNVNIVEKTFIIFLCELEVPFLADLCENDLRFLELITESAAGILWISRSSLSGNPEMCLVEGFARSIRSENELLCFITLLIDDKENTSQLADHVSQIYNSYLNGPQDEIGLEYRAVDGVLHSNRIIESNLANEFISKRVSSPGPEPTALGPAPRRALMLTVGSPGMLDTLQFVDDTNVEQPLEPQEVEIAVQAVGVNFKNIMVALGQLPDTSLAQECAGIITRTGPEVDTSCLRCGDRVCCLALDAFKTYVRSRQSYVCRIPSLMPFSTAAAIPIAFCTAYYSVVTLGQLKQGESILIHSAAGGVGQLAVQIALRINATVYITVGTREKKQWMIDQYGIPESSILSSRDQTFAQGIRRITKGRGVDVVLNSLAGESLQRSLECVAPLGRFVEIGKKDFYMRRELSTTPFLSSITFASVDLRILASKAEPTVGKLMRLASSLIIEEGSPLHPPRPLHAYKCSKLEDAFRFLQGGKNIGKTIIELADDDVVQAVPSMKPTWFFDADVTYVLSGGLGGLGRSIARWMVRRGARHILFLSRSGATTEAASSLIKELNTASVQALALSCDVSNEAAVLSSLTICRERMPSIRGCIHASMVLKDGLFENMTLENFQAALSPKVQGSWNLHRHLPCNLDFFVLLSSAGGIFGNRGQSNYAAANTYQDALARHRISRGEKCISLNLGLILGVGFAAERQEVVDSLRLAGYEGIHESEFLAMLDYCIDPSLSLSNMSQLITGLGTQASLKAEGIANPSWMARPLFRNLRQMDQSQSEASTETKALTDYGALLSPATSLQGAAEVISTGLARRLAASLLKSEDDIEINKPVHSYGVDSLIAVELRYWLLKEIKADVSTFNIMRSESIFALSLLAAGCSEYVKLRK